MIQITNKISRLLLVFLASNLITVNMCIGIIGGCPDNENGRWSGGKRSISSNIPITVYVKSGQLAIRSHSLRSDITIRIINSFTMVYGEAVLAEKTRYILVDLKDNKNGAYTLNLTNQWGGHLYGEFILK